MTANELLRSFCHTSSGVTRELALSIAFDATGLSGRIAIAIGRHLHVEAAPNGTGGIESTGPQPVRRLALAQRAFLKLLPGSSTPPYENRTWLSPATCTWPASTPSCPGGWPRPL